MNLTLENSTILEENNITSYGNTGVPPKFIVTMAFTQVPGIICNIIALVAIGKDIRAVQIPTNILLFALCLTDIIAICVAVVWHLVRYTTPIIPDTFCAIKTVISPFLPIYSGCIGALMAIDRFLALCTPYFYKEKITVVTWSNAVKLAVIFLLLLCCLPLVGLGTIWQNTKSGVRICNQFYYHVVIREGVFGFAYACVGLFIITTIIICNVAVVYTSVKLHQKIAVLPDTRTSPQRKRISHAEQFAKLVGALTVVFIICWTPFNILIILHELNVPVDARIKSGIHILASLNFIIDPFVYIFIRKTSRQKILKFIQSLKCRTSDNFEVR